MDESTYERLLGNLDKQISQLKGSNKNIGLIITENMNLESLSKEQLILTHVLLHKFYSSKSGRGLTKESIEKLHKKVTKKLNITTKFDGLDIHG